MWGRRMIHSGHVVGDSHGMGIGETTSVEVALSQWTINWSSKWSKDINGKFFFVAVLLSSGALQFEEDWTTTTTRHRIVPSLYHGVHKAPIKSSVEEVRESEIIVH